MTEFPGTVFVDCPCCGTRVEARRQDGKVVGSWAKPAKAKPGEDALKAAAERLKAEKAKRESFLTDAQRLLKDEKRLLEEKFKRARDRVAREGDTGPPPSPFDLD